MASCEVAPSAHTSTRPYRNLEWDHYSPVTMSMETTTLQWSGLILNLEWDYYCDHVCVVWVRLLHTIWVLPRLTWGASMWVCGLIPGYLGKVALVRDQSTHAWPHSRHSWEESGMGPLLTVYVVLESSIETVQSPFSLSKAASFTGASSISLAPILEQQ